MKAQPLFVDQFIAALPSRLELPLWNKLDIRALQARMRRAERVVFDKQASTRVAELLRDIPELLVEQIQFARAPFDLCWIEYDADTLWRIVTGQEPDPEDRSLDQVVGLLIDHNHVNVFSRSVDGKMGMMPFAYNLNTEWPLEDQLRFADMLRVSRIGIDLWLWGVVASRLRAAGKADHLRVLRDTTMVEVLDDRLLNHQRSNESITRFIATTAGDLKNVVALLLVLNQPRITQYQHIPQRRGWIGNKPKPFLSHHTITVSLDARAQIVKVSEQGDGELRRRHRVRGHYCQNKTARDYARIAGCIHEWQPTHKDWTPWPDAPLDEREHWLCRVCDGKRWWRDEYHRGSEAEGFIEHEYKVTA